MSLVVFALRIGGIRCWVRASSRGWRRRRGIFSCSYVSAERLTTVEYPEERIASFEVGARLSLSGF